MKDEMLQVINENFIEVLLDMVNQNVQEALKKFQDNKNKEYERIQKQTNEIIGALNKLQTETENTINRDVNELRMKIDNIKEKVTHNMENCQKKNETVIQNKMEGHSSRIEQTENRISELEGEMAIKGKTKEVLVKQLKNCEKSMQELTDSIKRPNLRIIGIEKGEDVMQKECVIYSTK
jgi:chromosome segregation ATPase